MLNKLRKQYSYLISFLGLSWYWYEVSTALAMTNFRRGTYGAHKVGSSLQPNFHYPHEPKIELLTTCLRDQVTYHLDQFIGGIII
jgi:hypothetical protein